MSATFRLSAYRRLPLHLAARINALKSSGSLRKIRQRIVSAIERALQDVFGGGGRLVPIPVRATVTRKRDQRRSHD
jgi:hypothetical protein